MGDTYFIEKIVCAYCGKENNFVDEGRDLFPGLAWQFEFGADFVCKYCKKKNKIEIDFRALRTKNHLNRRKRPSK